MIYSLIIKNCGQILTMKNGSEFEIIKNGFISCEENQIASVGAMSSLNQNLISRDTKIIDAAGRVVMPGLIDCHTHLVFAGDRSNEFAMRLAGKSYLEILAEGGGILSTVAATRAANFDDLLADAVSRAKQMLEMGITTIEAKSSYGLNLETEIKILKVLKEISKKVSVRIVPTFLGAHTTPNEFKNNSTGYLEFIKNEIFPKIKHLAEFVDIFCEKKAFSLAQSKKYLTAAKKAGFKLKIHGEQINRLGACVMAAKLGAVSVDHCEKLSANDIRALAKTNSTAVLLPLASFFLNEKKWANGRALIDAGVPVAIATDFNPGSAPCNNILLAASMACLKMGLTIEESLKAITINAARALALDNEIGSIEKKKIADIVITNARSYKEIPYRCGRNIVKTVIIGGKAKY